MRTIIAVLMMCLLCHPLVTAAEPTGGVLLAAGIREATRLGSLELVTAQAVTPNKRSGHPVLIGAAIGAGAGALLGYLARRAAFLLLMMTWRAVRITRREGPSWEPVSEPVWER